MAKNILQDIKKIKTTPAKLNALDGLKRGTNFSKNQNTEQDFRVINSKFSSVYDSFEKEKKSSSFYSLWIVAFVAIIFLFFAISFLFSSAEITVNPKTKNFTFDKSLVATKTLNTDNLSYNSIVLSGEESKKIPTGEEKEYVESARGTVLIYNTFSTASQTIAANSKLEGSNGKIYKTKTKVIIPGMSKKESTPGKTSVEIYGLEPGEEYNSSPLDFKILGFKGTTKYNKIYARSVGEILGGLKGKARQLSDADKRKAVDELKVALSEKLFKKAKDQTPKDYVLFQDANYLNIDEEKVGSVSEDGNVTITIKGTFYGFLFKEKDISKKIISSLLEEKDKSEVYLANVSDLKFSLDNKDIITFTDATDINFNLSGSIKMVWKVDSGKILADILGKSKKDFNQILSNYPNIESMNLSIKPIWKSSIPENSKKVKIIVNYPK